MGNVSLLKLVSTFGRAENERRTTGRFAIEGVTCDRGTLLDLSASGARIIRRFNWPVGSFKLIAIKADDQCVVARARSMRCVRTGVFRYDVGLAFEDMSQDSRERLIRMAMMYSRSTDFIRASA